MSERDVRNQRLVIAAQLLAATDIVGSSTNDMNGKITSALLIAEALIRANEETPVTFSPPPFSEEDMKAAFKKAQVGSNDAMNCIKGKPLSGSDSTE